MIVEILGEGSSGSEESSGDESDEEDSEGDDIICVFRFVWGGSPVMSPFIAEEAEAKEGGAEGKMDITDKTDSKALSLRRTIYLTIMSR